MKQDLGGLTYTLLRGPFIADGANGLPDITSNIIMKNGTITKDKTLPFRLLHISNHGSLSLKKVILTNDNDASGSGGGDNLCSSWWDFRYCGRFGIQQ